MSKENLQEKYVLYQLLNQNLESLKQQMQLVEQQFIEVKTTMLSIEDFKKVGEKNEIFLPLGSGCYGKGKITENNEILVNIGAGVFADKKRVDANSFLEKRVGELEKASDEIQAQMERVAKQMNVIGSEIQELSKQEGKP
ncbi:MAG: prefoldin subunit alpha [Candidatus Aenigmarchaeota archaeon]